MAVPDRHAACHRACLSLLSLVLTACATNPATGDKELTVMSEVQEIALGQPLDPEVRQQMGVQGVAEQALGVLFFKYGRDDELQADRLRVRYTAAADWNPVGVAGY